MRAASFPLLAVFASACAQLPHGAPSAAPQPTRDWLVGAWVPEGESCESDAGVRYRRDGTWFAYESAGTWRLEGWTIVSTVTNDFTDGGMALSPVAEQHVQTVKVLGPDLFEARWGDSTVTRLRRCPGGPE